MAVRHQYPQEDEVEAAWIAAEDGVAAWDRRQERTTEERVTKTREVSTDEETGPRLATEEEVARLKGPRARLNVFGVNVPNETAQTPNGMDQLVHEKNSVPLVRRREIIGARAKR